MHFSIVTPSFNHADWLRLCLASVADQISIASSSIRTFAVEHLVQDGGSRDETSRMLEAWKAEVQNRALKEKAYAFRYFSDPDYGMYDALNKGFSHASGDVFSWLNCDEQYLPGTLERVAAYFSAHPEVDILFGDFIMADAQCRPLCYRRVVTPTAWHTRLCHLNTATCAMFFRRALWEEFRLETRWRMIGDADLVWKSARAGKRFACLPHPLALHVHTDRNMSSTRAFREEQRDWRHSAGILVQGFAPFCAADYLIRKWLAGAYRIRRLELAPYEPGDPPVRKPIQAYRLDWRWPKFWMSGG